MKATELLKLMEKLGYLVESYKVYQETQIKTEREYEIVGTFISDLENLILSFVKSLHK